MSNNTDILFRFNSSIGASVKDMETAILAAEQEMGPFKSCAFTREDMAVFVSAGRLALWEDNEFAAMAQRLGVEPKDAKAMFHCLTVRDRQHIMGLWRALREAAEAHDQEKIDAIIEAICKHQAGPHAGEIRLKLGRWPEVEVSYEVDHWRGFWNTSENRHRDPFRLAPDKWKEMPSYRKMLEAYVARVRAGVAVANAPEPMIPLSMVTELLAYASGAAQTGSDPRLGKLYDEIAVVMGLKTGKELNSEDRLRWKA